MGVVDGKDPDDIVGDVSSSAESDTPCSYAGKSASLSIKRRGFVESGTKLCLRTLRRKEDATVCSDSPHKLSFTPREHGDADPATANETRAVGPGTAGDCRRLRSTGP